MTRSANARTPSQRAGDERLNDQFHTLLREAAEKREGLDLIYTTRNQAEAKQESADLLALARSGVPGRGNRTAEHRQSRGTVGPSKVQRLERPLAQP
jgi:hypothetical protein